MFIGEGPGAREDELGRPFVGASGKFLDQLLEQAGVTRADVWITNVVKCRPPGNRDPLPDEIHTCTGNYLQRQIEIVDPSIIVTLGRHSMGLFFKGAKITDPRTDAASGRALCDRHVSPGRCAAPTIAQVRAPADFARLRSSPKRRRPSQVDPP